jgi:hypothetical protein
MLNQEPWQDGYPSSNGASADAPREGFSRLLVLAYITAISIPPLGLALGIAVAVRLGKPKHAAWIILISLLTAAIWVLLLTSNAFNNPSSTDF